MPIKIIPAIMSGGVGSRLWPLSTQNLPKQFHAIGHKDTLIQGPVRLFAAPYGELEFRAPIVIANERHGALVHAQLAEIGVAPSVIALEPVGRSTAATALLAARLSHTIDPEALTLLLPADHIIHDVASFLSALARAAATARDHIVTFGIEPTEPAIGYGYIERGEELDTGVYAIKRFHEKPEVEVARQFVAGGRHSWNAGIFLFASETVSAEFRHAPKFRDCVDIALANSKKDGVFLQLPENLFVKTPAESFDIAIMEKTDRGAVAPCDIGWADLGSWSEVWRNLPQNSDANAA
jgi:mannose-1-phosphate guanylyltransferase/mannose-6-phosphate isomerase